ncbi:FtsX-like permease family protein [Nucisporomicrobium flavum]|uniref:FtsX-like permease family protein n=1 Tax=Nucisporomicrobium flavum TaxID=2785915 RepID=UPI003C2E1A52
MGRMLLVSRLAMRDLRRRRAEAALLLLCVLAATTTLTLALVLRDAASDPYQRTRAITKGPDVVATGPLSRLETLSGASGVAGHSGPFPVTAAKLRTSSSKTSDVQAVGRDSNAATVDQPLLTDGAWAGPNGVVLEAAFARALDVGVGDQVTLAGRSFSVTGVAITASSAPYPGSLCLVPRGCVTGSTEGAPAGVLRNPGLVWLTRADVMGVAQKADNQFAVLNLKLADPDGAQAFIDANGGRGPRALPMHPWQNILGDATELAHNSQILLFIGTWLLALLAVASLSVLVGGRMADQTRRVGLLKAVGATPGLVAAVLVAEYVMVAVSAAGGGLAIGTFTAPLLTGSSAGLIGGAGTPSVTLPTIVWVITAALAVAVIATAAPAVRAARSSTVDALADAPRPPRRMRRLTAVSSRLPIPLLLALRLAVRRPRRVLLGIAIVLITVSGIYVLLILNTYLGTQELSGGYGTAQVEVLRHVLLVWSVILLSLAAVNTIAITWATVLDNRHASALVRALGATPAQMTTALVGAQVLPALLGAVLGVFPGGPVLFHLINAIAGGAGDRATLPTPWQATALIAAVLVVVAALTAVPARVGGRRPVTETL